MTIIDEDDRVGRLYVDGKWVDGEKGAIDLIDPSTGQIIGQAAEASLADVRGAAAAARAAQPAWAAIGPAERARLLEAIATEIRRDAGKLINLCMTDGGFTQAISSYFVAQAEAWFEMAAAGALRDYTIATPPALGSRPDGSSELLNGVIQHRPIGVVGCLVPFNAPLVATAMKASEALAMGNTVVIKPAPQDPLVVCELFRIIERVGLPPGAANLVTSSDPEVGAELVRSRDTDMITFTGSTQVGREVYRAGADTMKRLVLELGGKGACIVFDDADMEAAAQGLASVWRVNTGQVCSAPTRAIVQRGIHDRLVERLVELAAGVVVGSPFNSATIAGPVVSEAQRDRIEAFIQSAREQGAELLTDDPARAYDRGYFVSPALLTNCDNQMKAVRNEIFGPVITVVPFDTEDEAVAIANDSDYGLVSYVFAGSAARAFAVGNRLQAGTIQLNTISVKPGLPRGGVKMSGLGREGGDIGRRQFTEMSAMVWS